MLPCPVAFEDFQAVAWRNPKIVQRPGLVEHCQLANRRGLDSREPRHASASEHRFGVLTAKRLDHERMSQEEILADFPDLTADDIRAALAFAADRERRLFSAPS